MKKQDFDSAVDLIGAYIDSNTQIDSDDISSVTIDIKNQDFTLKFYKRSDIKHTFEEAECNKELCKNCLYSDECDSKNDYLNSPE